MTLSVKGFVRLNTTLKIYFNIFDGKIKRLKHAVMRSYSVLAIRGHKYFVFTSQSNEVGHKNKN